MTLNELADIYDKYHGGNRSARTLPIPLILDWAEKRTDLFWVDEEDYFHLVDDSKNEEHN